MTHDRTTRDLDTALRTLSQQAADYSRTGPKRKEDDTHVAINALLDARGECNKQKEG